MQARFGRHDVTLCERGIQEIRTSMTGKVIGVPLDSIIAPESIAVHHHFFRSEPFRETLELFIHAGFMAFFVEQGKYGS